MDVDAPLGGEGQNLIREHLSIGRHHNELRLKLLQKVQGLPIPKGLGLKNRDLKALGANLHRGRLELVLVTAHRLIRLAEDANHLMPRLHQSLQRRDGKIGGSHKDDSHLCSSSASMASSSSLV